MSAMIWTVFESDEQARGVVSKLLEEELIACANIIANMQSIFLWNGKIDEQKECGALLKTDQSLIKAAISRLEQLHPYKTPAILGWQCSEVGVATEKWLGELDGGDLHESDATT